MNCQRCENLLKTAEETIELWAQVQAQLAISELEGNRVKAKRLRNLVKTTEQNREQAAAAYRAHVSSHLRLVKTRHAGAS